MKNRLAPNRINLQLRVAAFVFVACVAPAALGQDAVGGLRMIDHPASRSDYAELLAWRRMLPEARPGARGYRAALVAPGDSRGVSYSALAKVWPFDVARGGDAGVLAAAADLVAKRIAVDGLPVTFARVERQLAEGVPGYLSKPFSERELLLRRVGLPTDLLPFFIATDVAGSERDSAAGGATVPPLVRAIDEAIAAGRSEADVLSLASGATFSFRATRPGFRAATESGEHEIGWVRMQASTGSYFQGPGDGGCMDMMHQMLAALPDAHFIISIERKHAAAFLSTSQSWPLRRRADAALVIEDLPLSQWAQDNGKAGTIGADAGSDTTGGETEQVQRVIEALPLTLVPRYASRGEDGSIFVSGDSFACEGVAAAGLAWAQSPLMFQSGNLLPIWDAARGRRVLLVGEAEVWRNVSLGLTEPQVRAALAAEMGCDEVVVLPAVSYHIDYEVSVRVVGGRVVAMVNDEDSAASEVVRAGLKRLFLPELTGPPAASTDAATREAAAAVRQVEQLLTDGRLRDAAGLAGDILRRASVGPGRWPLALAERLTTEPGESGVGNLQLVLTAVDILRTSGAAESDFPGVDHESAYYRSLCRRRSQRLKIKAALEHLGWQVMPVPGIADGEKSICYLNGIHARGRYLMPVHGGVFEPVDDRAKRAIRAAVGPDVQLHPIRCSESFRRDGAVHCSASVYPAIAR